MKNTTIPTNQFELFAEMEETLRSIVEISRSDNPDDYFSDNFSMHFEYAKCVLDKMHFLRKNKMRKTPIVHTRIQKRGDEYVVKAYRIGENGIERYKEADYFAMDLQDAKQTALAMVQ